MYWARATIQVIILNSLDYGLVLTHPPDSCLDGEWLQLPVMWKQVDNKSSDSVNCYVYNYSLFVFTLPVENAL